ncbi:hypothetical protein SCHPADRAFT_119420 [Schizopora paradoxa]|uniref:Uncharacterized protein n=1 Tax=Schizopora paradoxa TaxID=27342 RepID=A0A0H2S9W7_9AGAM|nr:hypothetical protein SCHPADRAFT_119420 [Schizopora paradoxa]
MTVNTELPTSSSVHVAIGRQTFVVSNPILPFSKTFEHTGRRPYRDRERTLFFAFFPRMHRPHPIIRHLRTIGANMITLFKAYQNPSPASLFRRFGAMMARKTTTTLSHLDSYFRTKFLKKRHGRTREWRWVWWKMWKITGNRRGAKERSVADCMEMLSMTNSGPHIHSVRLTLTALLRRRLR